MQEQLVLELIIASKFVVLGVIILIATRLLVVNRFTKADLNNHYKLGEESGWEMGYDDGLKTSCNIHSAVPDSTYHEFLKFMNERDLVVTYHPDQEGTHLRKGRFILYQDNFIGLSRLREQCKLNRQVSRLSRELNR